MDANCVFELEQLLMGKKDKLEFPRTKTTNRDLILECLHKLIMIEDPDRYTDGGFLDSDDYIIYELQIKDNKRPMAIRVFDFGDKFTLLRV